MKGDCSFAVVDDDGNVYGHDLDYADACMCRGVNSERENRDDLEIISQDDLVSSGSL